jgi:hypothetical protein
MYMLWKTVLQPIVPKEVREKEAPEEIVDSLHEVGKTECTATNLTVGEEGRKKGRQEICGGRHRLRQGIYTVTSHSSQGQTADLVLIHVDIELWAKNLLRVYSRYGIRSDRRGILRYERV